jgi:tyrosyl-tRNA synthetase
MIAKESVRRRLESREQGISYTEFTYMMVQAYDFWHLRDTLGCELQVGGNDQWGNITAGTDLIHKRGAGRAFGMTVPLITTASGEKFGKSAGNAVWLDGDLTSPYAFYQFWLNSDDADLSRWLRIFTFLDLATIEKLVAEHARDPGRRAGQRALADEVTRIVHGDAGLARAQQASDILFGGAIDTLTDDDVAAIFGDVPSTTIPRAELEAGLPWIDLLARTVCASKGAARKLVKQGGAYLNNRRVTDEDQTITPADLASEGALVLRSGKRTYHVVRVA